MRKQTSLVPTLALAVAAAAGATACGPSGDDTSGGCKTDFLPGDLVITEIMANPAGEDSGSEWFEVFNASGRTVDLTGLTLAVSRADGTAEATHEVQLATAIAPGAYVVLGNMASDLLPAWADYGYASSMADLRNDAGRVALRCGDAEIDHVVYGAADSGASQSLTGSSAPDYLENDNPARWCNSTVEFTTGQLGSPGEANEVCPGGPLPTECTDPGTGATRALVPLAPGDLVITEILPDPSAAADAAAEWFEVYVTRDVDLNGLEIGTEVGSPRVTLVDTACLRAAAGTYLVFARSDDPTLNGGLPAVDHTFSFGLSNSGGSLFLGVQGSMLDQVSWGPASAGTATGLDPGKTDTTQNDDPLAWCKATTPYGAGDRGSPGAANPACPVVVPEGKCLDGGVQRDVVPPVEGQLVITEMMANPEAAADASGEWFEVLATADVDLNGLELGTTPPTVKMTLGDATCLHAAANTYLVFARSDEPTLNGGLPQVDYTFGFAITNTSGGLFVGRAGAVLDQITYGSTTAGASRSLDPGKLSVTDNDLEASWCPGVATYGAGDLGTPGGANSACQ